MSEPKKEASEGKAKKKVPASAVIAVVAVAVIAVLVVVILHLLNPNDDNPPAGGEGVFVTEDNVDEVIDSMNEPISDASYTANMSNDWTFENGQAEAEGFYVKNSESNSRTVYFTLQLADTNEQIYSSPYIPVGGEMTSLTLDKDLEAGDYNVVMTYHLVDDERTELTTVSVAVAIHIKN